MAVYKINKKILLQEGNGIFEPRSLSDSGFIMKAMKEKNNHQVGGNNAIFGSNKHSLDSVANNYKNKNTYENTHATHDRTNDQIRPVHFDNVPKSTYDIGPQYHAKYDKIKQDTMYAKHQTDSFKPLHMNKTGHEPAYADDNAHIIQGH